MNIASDSAPKGEIFVIDDTPENVRLLSMMLVEQGYKVRKSINGKMGLTAIQAAPPDLILLDIMMPDMDGYQVCNQLKASEETCQIPVIFLSALDDVFDKVKAFNAGGVDYINKPFQFAEVLARIENHLTIRRLQKQLSSQNLRLQEEVEERKQVEAALRSSEAELKHQKEQLSEAIQEIKNTQATLIQTEKMASLGQLVAGIAHEINNPISFIYGNLNHVNNYTKDLLSLVDLYRQALPDANPEIQTALEEIDIDFVGDDLPKTLASMQAGVERIRKIVMSLRSFARLGEADLKVVDIHEGIESTLTMLQHRLTEAETGEILTLKEYQSLPLVECYAGQINQVLMHIITNAIDALQGEFLEQRSMAHTPRAAKHGQPTLKIRTEQIQPDRIAIAISDNGPGMPEATQKRIFDPFFTTKPVGSGTGLGMSVSYQVIVEKHGGTITCESQPGQGTTIKIEIPINHLK